MSKTKLLVLVFLLINVFVFSPPAEADGITKRIKFTKGKSSKTVSNAVIRGDEDTYIVSAKAGQKMSVKITSVKPTPFSPSKNRMANISKKPERAMTKLTGVERFPTPEITKFQLTEQEEMPPTNYP